MVNCRYRLNVFKYTCDFLEVEMRIDYHNKEIINKIYTHDAVFKGFDYDYENNLIQFEMVEGYYKKRFKFIFHNVFGFKMASCDFWGKCLRTDTWHTADENEIAEELTEIKEKKRGRSEDGKLLESKSRLNSVEECVESTLYFISGDSLTIACEYIDFEEIRLAE